MGKCLYCKKELNDNFISNKVGDFCSDEHYDKFLKSLTKDEYIELQNTFCVCSDD